MIDYESVTAKMLNILHNLMDLEYVLGIILSFYHTKS